MSGGKKKKQTSTQSIEAPDYLQDDLRYITDEARSLYDQGMPAYYSGNMVADFTPEQMQAFGLTTQRALDGSPLVDGAQNFATDLVNGKYQDNPYLNDMIDILGRKANMRVNESFNASGRLGSGANVDTGVRAITEAQLPFLLNQYNTGINQRLQGASMAPMLANQDYVDLSKLAAVGEAKQGQDQRVIDADVAKYNYEAFSPYQALQNYANTIYSSPGNNHTTSTNVQTQSGGSGLGSLVGAGLSLAGGFGGGGFGGLFSNILGSSGAAGGALGRSIGGFTGGQQVLGNGDTVYWR